MPITRRTALAGGALLLVGGGRAVAADVAGTVLTLRGDCTVTAGGQATPLATGSPIHVGDTIDVADGARLKLQMNDGSIISAASGTHMTIDRYTPGSSGAPRDVHIGLGAGLLRAVVSSVTQPSRYEVETAIGVAAVRSTDWFVASSEKGTQVGTLEGLVTLTDRAEQREVRIPARWGARILGPGVAPTPPRLWKDAEFADVIERTDLP